MTLHTPFKREWTCLLFIWRGFVGREGQVSQDGWIQHQGLFQWVTSLHQVAKYWSFIFNISPSDEYSGLISFRIDWLDLLAVQGTQELSPIPQFKASVLQRSAFFMVKFSHPYMTTGKTIVLTKWSLVGKVVSLLFNMLSQLVTAFLSRNKHLLIARLQSLSAVILE